VAWKVFPRSRHNKFFSACFWTSLTRLHRLAPISKRFFNHKQFCLQLSWQQSGDCPFAADGAINAYAASRFKRACQCPGLRGDEWMVTSTRLLYAKTVLLAAARHVKKCPVCQEAKYKLFGPPDIVWSMTLTLDVCQVTLPKIATLAIFSPKSTRATLQLAFPVSLIHALIPPGPRLASISSRSCA